MKWNILVRNPEKNKILLEAGIENREGSHRRPFPVDELTSQSSRLILSQHLPREQRGDHFSFSSGKACE